MEIRSAIRSAARIINHERRHPTVSYSDLGVNWVDQVAALTDALRKGEVNKQDPLSYTTKDGQRRLNITGMRTRPHRPVSDSPNQYHFSSINFELLTALFQQVQESDRAEFMTALLWVVEHGGDYCFPNEGHSFPSFDGKVSELPLIAEFAIRNGYKNELFAATAKAKIPTDGMTILMLQLEDTVCLNFSLFSEAELEAIPVQITPLLKMAEQQSYKATVDRSTQKRVENPDYIPGREKPAQQIVSTIHNLMREIDEALYLYLKGTLQQTTSVEIRNDLTRVEEYLANLGFSGNLKQALIDAQRLYHPASNGFDLKNCLGLLRSFLEHLHLEAVAAIAASTGLPSQTEWGNVISFLRRNGYLTPQEEKLVVGMYAVMSDQGAHPLTAEREYARLSLNMVTEYGLMFLTVLEKKGIKISAI